MEVWQALIEATSGDSAVSDSLIAEDWEISDSPVADSLAPDDQTCQSFDSAVEAGRKKADSSTKARS